MAEQLRHKQGHGRACHQGQQITAYAQTHGADDVGCELQRGQKLVGAQSKATGLHRQREPGPYSIPEGYYFH